MQRNSDMVDFSWLLNLILGKEIKNLRLKACTDIVPRHWFVTRDYQNWVRHPNGS